MEKGNGVKISTKEIYQLVLKTSKSVNRIESKVENIHEIEKNCRIAVEQSDEALCRVKELREQNVWLWRTIIGGIIAAAIGAVFLHLGGR
jgi:recombinational DNA repair protein RecR